LKYNLNYKRKNWIKISASEAEKAVNFLPVVDQDYFVWLVAKNKKYSVLVRSQM